MTAIMEQPIEEQIGTMPLHRFSVEDFHRLGTLGFFTEDDRLELIEGEIVDMAPIGSNHASILARLNKAITKQIGDNGLVFPQNPLKLSQNSEVYPDLTLLKPRSDDYRTTIPIAGDALLVIEVSDTTLRYDRSVKVPLYAHHGVPEVWLFDVENGKVEIFRQPSIDGYRMILRPENTETIVPEQLPEVRVDLAEIWR